MLVVALFSECSLHTIPGKTFKLETKKKKSKLLRIYNWDAKAFLYIHNLLHFTAFFSPDING